MALPTGVSKDSVRAVYEAIAATLEFDSVGNFVNPDAYAQTLTYNGDGTVATISFTDGTYTWTQTFTYTTGLVTGISKWVRS